MVIRLKWDNQIFGTFFSSLLNFASTLFFCFVLSFFRSLSSYQIVRFFCSLFIFSFFYDLLFISFLLNQLQRGKKNVIVCTCHDYKSYSFAFISLTIQITQLNDRRGVSIYAHLVEWPNCNFNVIFIFTNQNFIEYALKWCEAFITGPLFEICMEP